MGTHYVLRFGGKGPPPESAFEQISRLSGVSIRDRSDRMVSVEGARPVLEAFAGENPEWRVFEEQQYTLPEKRHSVREE